MGPTKNPYRTAPGSEPPELAGRSGELGAAAYAIAMSKERQPAKPLVFTGLRGLGKTTLLRRVIRDADRAGAISILGEADASLRFGDVLHRGLSKALERSESLPARLRTALGRIVAALPKIAYEFPHGAGGVSLEGHEAPRDVSGGDDSLEGTLHELNAQAHRHGRFLTIGLDEIQESRREDLLRIIRVVHETAGTEKPVLFFGAGLPDSGDVLRLARTYTERWAFYRLALLTRNETAEAVDVPARALGARWEQDAIDGLYARSLGYPYFVQEFASAAWIHHDGDVVRSEDVRAIWAGVQRMLDETFYDRQFTDLSPREASYVLALHRLGPGVHHTREIADQLNTGPEHLSSLRAQLLRKGVLYTAGRGLTEFRVPLTDGYISRHMEEIVRRAGVSLVRRPRARGDVLVPKRKSQSARSTKPSTRVHDH